MSPYRSVRLSASNLVIATSLLIVTCLTSTLGMAQSKGVGPVQDLKLEALDSNLAKKGKGLFTAKCSACHKFTERYVGPSLKDVTKRRSPEWVMNMILNPVEMTQKDPAAQELLGEYLTQMTFQNVSQDEARSILEYFRHFDEKGDLMDAPPSNKSKKSKK